MSSAFPRIFRLTFRWKCETIALMIRKAWPGVDAERAPPLPLSQKIHTKVVGIAWHPPGFVRQCLHEFEQHGDAHRPSATVPLVTKGSHGIAWQTVPVVLYYNLTVESGCNMVVILLKYYWNITETNPKYYSNVTEILQKQTCNKPATKWKNLGNNLVTFVKYGD